MYKRRAIINERKPSLTTSCNCRAPTFPLSLSMSDNTDSFGLPKPTITLAQIAAGDYETTDTAVPASGISAASLQSEIETVSERIKKWSQVDAFNKISRILLEATHEFTSIENRKKDYRKDEYKFSVGPNIHLLQETLFSDKH